MGAMISLVITEFALIAAGVMSVWASIEAQNNKDCQKARTINIWTAVVAFVIAALTFMLTVFLL